MHTAITYLTVVFFVGISGKETVFLLFLRETIIEHGLDMSLNVQILVFLFLLFYCLTELFPKCNQKLIASCQVNN